MKRTILALLLVLTLLLSLLAGCASKSAETAAETPAETSAEPAGGDAQTPADATAPEAAEPAQTETSQPAAAPEEQTAAPADDGTYVSPGGIAYPIGDGTQEVSFWASYGGFWAEYVNSLNDIMLLPYIVDYTGVNYRFIEVSEGAATEQFSLMVASGDWPDTVQATDYYTGGLGQAFEDEFVADLTSLLPTDAPDYYQALQDTNDTTVKSLLTDGMSLAVYSVKDVVYSDRGGALRSDWAGELGYDVSQLSQELTLTTFTDLLYDMYETYGGDATLYMTPGGSTAAVGQAFGVSLPSISSPTALTYYRQDDQIVCSFVQDGFRDYLEWFAQLYRDGVINGEFYVSELAESAMFTQIANGQIGSWATAANVIDGVLDYTDEAITTTAIPGVIADENVGKITQWGSDTVLADNKGYSICADCEDIPLVLNFYNYFYTQPGAVFCNYGVEGLTWEYRDDGSIDYSDKIYNDPDGVQPMVAQNLYTFSMVPRFMYVSTQYTFYDEASLAALDVWLVEDYESLHSVPTDAALTTAETSSISNEVSDILAYTSEQILKFMTGLEPITDETWSAYCGQCRALGLDTCMALYQNAYNEYLRGERTAEASSGGDSAPPAPSGGDEGGPPPAP